MATKNLVPRGSGEGSIGTSSKKWNDAHFVSGSFDELKIKYAKDSTGSDLIVGAGVSRSTETGQYTITGSGSGSSDKIFEGSVSVETIDTNSSTERIEFNINSTLKWTIDTSGNFIPEANVEIGSSAKGLNKLYLDSSGLVYLGTSQLKVSSSKLQLSNNSGTNFYDIITTNDLSSYLTSESDTLSSVVSRGATTSTQITVNDVKIGSASKEITLSSITSDTNENISIKPNGTGVTRIGGATPGTDSVDVKSGEVNIKSGGSASHIKLYRQGNSYYTQLQTDNTLLANKTLNLPVPTGSSGTLALLSDVTNMSSGVKAQASARAATTTNGVLASAYANGQSIDGVTLATGDRILIKNQTTKSENGVYTVNATGVPTRATDFDSNYSVAGYFIFIEEGTTQKDTGWLCTNDSSNDTPGTHDLNFVFFAAAGQIEGGTGLTKTSNVLSVDASQSQITTVGELSALSIAGDTTFKGNLVLKDSDATNSITIKAPATGDLTSDYILTLPVNDGVDGQFLKTNGSGVLSWAAASGGGGISDIFDDKTPQLGGPLEINSQTITGSLIPTSDNSQDIGSLDFRWKDLHLSNRIYIKNSILHTYVDSSNKYQISNTSAGKEINALFESDSGATETNTLGLTFKNNTQVSGATLGKFVFNIGSASLEKASIDFTKTGTGASDYSLGFNVNDASGSRNRILINPVNDETLISMPLGLKKGITASTWDEGEISFYEKSTKGNHFVKIKAPEALSSSYILTLPTNDGEPGEFLKTNGTGTLSWSSNEFTVSGVSDTKSTIHKDDDFVISDSEDSDANKQVSYGTIKDSIFSDYASNTEVTLDYNTNTNKITGTIGDGKVTVAKLQSINNNNVIGNVSGSASSPTTVEISTDNSFENPADTKLASQKAIKDYINTYVVSNSGSTDNSTSYEITDSNMTVTLGDDVWGKLTEVKINTSTNPDNYTPVIYLPVGTNSVRLGQSFTIKIDISSLDTSLKFTNIGNHVFFGRNQNDPTMFYNNTITNGGIKQITPGGFFNFSSSTVSNSDDPYIVTIDRPLDDDYGSVISQNSNVALSVAEHTNGTYGTYKTRTLEDTNSDGSLDAVAEYFLPQNLSNSLITNRLFNPKYYKQIVSSLSKGSSRYIYAPGSYPILMYINSKNLFFEIKLKKKKVTASDADFIMRTTPTNLTTSNTQNITSGKINTPSTRHIWEITPRNSSSH